MDCIEETIITGLYGETRKCCVQRKLTSSRIIDIVSVSRYMVVGGEPVAVVPPGSPPYYYRYYPLYMVTSRDC